MVEVFMGVEVFHDSIGQRIKALMINYGLETTKLPIDKIEESVDKTHQIVSFSRQACVDVLNAEADILCFRQVMGDKIPMEFISGVIHASRVLSHDNSIIGKGWDEYEE
jgi:type III secretory pathway component EscU